MAIGKVATLDSSRVRLPAKPASTKPAVAWTSRPRRPRLDLPSSRATRSTGSATRSRVEPSTNSPGWSMKGSPSPTVTSSVRSGWATRVTVVGEDPEAALHAHVDGRRLHGVVAKGVDLDSAGVELGPDVAVGQDHGVILEGRPAPPPDPAGDCGLTPRLAILSASAGVVQW